MADWVIRLIDGTGYFGVFALMLLETMFPPVPSEVIMPVAGLRAANGPMTLGGVIASGTAGAINRRPGVGEIRSNLALGGTAEATQLTDTEQEICAALGPELKRRGLLFVGIDVIGGKWLTEINVTSPTGIVPIDKFNGTDTAGRIWDAIERRVTAGNSD